MTGATGEELERLEVTTLLVLVCDEVVQIVEDDEAWVLLRLLREELDVTDVEDARGVVEGDAEEDQVEEL